MKVKVFAGGHAPERMRIEDAIRQLNGGDDCLERAFDMGDIQSFEITGFVDETESEENIVDNVKHPSHYRLPGLSVETIDVVRAVLGPEGFMKFCRGCALKYLIRADRKGGKEDLEKAAVFIGWEIEECDRLMERKYSTSLCDGNRK
ncbi:DUF3310 domain-containing protein [Eubacterium pyruvativorans]|uniref:DUF3310 domain-containing protein n=1 Tax=Eubacterium pyruvativorans TaxID=155865 RepID=UPI003F897CF3